MPTLTGAAEKQLGTPVVMESNGPQLADGGFSLCDEGIFNEAAVDGAEGALVELRLAGGYSAAPTESARIYLYSQTRNSSGELASVASALFREKLVASFPIAPTVNSDPGVVVDIPVNYWGGNFVVEWLDGGSGTASILSGWTLTVTPYKIGPQP